MKAVALVAVLLASLGLYGMVSINVSGRRREFSIRKVLGAEVTSIASTIARQYVVLTVVAMVVGGVASFSLMRTLFNVLYSYPMPIGFTGIAMAMVILLAVLVAVIGTQVRSVARASAVDGLKGE